MAHFYCFVDIGIIIMHISVFGRVRSSWIDKCHSHRTLWKRRNVQLFNRLGARTAIGHSDE